MYGFTSNFYDNLADELSVAAPALIITGYVLMMLYCAAAFFKFDLTRSRSNAGLVRNYNKRHNALLTCLGWSVPCCTGYSCCFRHHCCWWSGVHNTYSPGIYKLYAFIDYRHG